MDALQRSEEAGVNRVLVDVALGYLRLPARADVHDRVSSVVRPGRVAYPDEQLSILSDVDRLVARFHINATNVPLVEGFERDPDESSHGRLAELLNKLANEPVFKAISILLAHQVVVALEPRDPLFVVNADQ